MHRDDPIVSLRTTVGDRSGSDAEDEGGVIAGWMHARIGGSDDQDGALVRSFESPIACDWACRRCFNHRDRLPLAKNETGVTGLCGFLGRVMTRRRTGRVRACDHALRAGDDRCRNCQDHQ